MLILSNKYVRIVKYEFYDAILSKNYRSADCEYEIIRFYDNLMIW